MSSQILKSFDVQADSNGYWEYHANSSLFSTGSYRVQVQDDSGKTQEKSLIVLQKTANQTTLPQAPSFFSRENAINLIYFILLLAIIALLGFNLYYLIRKSSSRISRTQINLRRNPKGIASRQISRNFTTGKTKKHLSKKIKLLFLAIIILIIIALGAILAFRYYNKIKAPSIVNVSGSLINPLNNQGFSGVDLASGNISIKTSNSGAYNFNQIKSDEGIKITYPTLLKSLVETADKSGNQNIYFNPDMDNVLIRVIDFEARSQLDKIYPYLYPAAKQKITLSDFTKNYQSIFTSADINNQTINLGKTEVIGEWNNKKYDLLIPQVVAINVINRDQDETFYLVFDSNQWWIVK